MSEVKHLEINYKTDELFEAFREFGNKDLYMVEELQGQMIDASSNHHSMASFTVKTLLPEWLY